jgi:hypothetical protein
MHVRTNRSSAFDEMRPPSFSTVTTAAASAFRTSHALDLRRDPIHLSEIRPCHFRSDGTHCTARRKCLPICARSSPAPFFTYELFRFQVTHSL